MRVQLPIARLTRVGRQPIGLGASALAAVSWGFTGIFAVLAFAPGLVVTFYRLWLTAALFSIVLYASGRRLTWATMRASWLGGVFLALDIALFISAVKLTSVVDVTVIVAVQPALVLVAARRLFGERMGRWGVFWILLAMVGVAIAVLGPGVNSHNQLVGDLLAVGALLSWSSYWLVSKHAREMHNAMEYTTGVAIAAAVVATPIVLLSNEPLARVRAGDWLWISLLALVPGTGNLVMNWAHRYVDASVSSAINCLNPLVAAAAAWIILGQPLTLVQVGGILVGLTAISVVAAQHREPMESIPL
jgi:drug/metabolite transporter (DMT)-like permease